MIDCNAEEARHNADMVQDSGPKKASGRSRTGSEMARAHYACGKSINVSFPESHPAHLDLTLGVPEHSRRMSRRTSQLQEGAPADRCCCWCIIYT